MIPRKLRGKFEAAVEYALEHIKGVVLAAFLLVAVLSAIVGYRYYRFSQDDPRFCVSCHLMKTAYTDWERGKHSDVVCQQCHQLSIFEKNRLLLAYVVKGNQPLAQTHGREKPWQSCRDCHMENVAQGSLTMSKSDGHARHVFIEKVQCKVCHKMARHNFDTDATVCQNCHKDKGVHGLGSGTPMCLKCHAFSDRKPALIPRDRCIACHAQIPPKGPMSGLLCHRCHDPHGTTNPTTATCSAECHRKEVTVGRHALHLRRVPDCMYCHKPHTWTVGKDMAKKLCGKCHAPSNPQLFID